MAKSTKQERKPSQKSAFAQPPIRLPVGAPAGAAIAAQLGVRDPGKKFRVELPGAVYAVGAAYSYGILPLARIKTVTGKTARIAAVHFSEKSEALTRAATIAALRMIGRKRPGQFSLLVESNRMSFSDVFDAASVGRRNKKSSIGTVDIRLQFKVSGGATVRSKPVPGVMFADPVETSEEVHDEVAFRSLLDPWYVFDCHSEWTWDGSALRWFTVCNGTCGPATSCTQGNPPKRSAWGLNTCWC